MPLDTRDLRNALGCFVTGVTVITTLGPRGEPVGITANSFNSVSMEPPLVLFSLGRRAHSLKGFLSTHEFAVNVLREDQQALSNRFARSLADKWAGVDYVTWDTGCPILVDAAASFECRIRYTHNGGDHVIFVGEVLHMACDLESRPLLYYRGGYRGIGEEI